jgi:hypothetical protein
LCEFSGWSTSPRDVTLPGDALEPGKKILELWNLYNFLKLSYDSKVQFT